MQGYVPDKNHLAVVFLEARLQVQDQDVLQPGKEHLVGLSQPCGASSVSPSRPGSSPMAKAVSPLHGPLWMLEAIPRYVPQFHDVSTIIEASYQEPSHGVVLDKEITSEAVGIPMTGEKDMAGAEPGSHTRPGSVGRLPGRIAGASPYLYAFGLGMVGPALHGDLQQTVLEVGADPAPSMPSGRFMLLLKCP